MGMPKDVRSAWRGIVRAPAFSLLVIATLTLGIGATTTMYGVMRAVFFRPLPFPQPDQLVTVWEGDPSQGVARQRLTGPNLVDWNAENHAFQAMGSLPNWTGAPVMLNVIGADGPARVPGLYASAGFFRVLGVAPMLGRTFSDEADHRMGARHLILSYPYWKARFGADAAIVGKNVEIDTFRGGQFTIVGVMPERFDFPSGTKIWLSLADWGGGPLPPLDAPERCCNWHATFARLQPGMTPERAAAELTTIAQRIHERHPNAPHVAQVQVVPLRESLVGSHRLALSALFGAVGCLLLIGCANVANLLLCRAVGRRKEVATRVALGATRWHIARQLLAESLLLCGIGTLAGVVLAVWAQAGLVRVLEGRIPLVEDSRLDLPMLAFAAALCIVCGVACGLAPMVGWGAADLKTRGETEGTASRRMRQWLVIGEVALAVSLIASAGLLVRTLASLQAVDVGFERDRILTASLDLTTGPMRERGNAARYLAELMPRIAALPGVQQSGASTGMPLEAGPAIQAITREDREPRLAAQSPQVIQTSVTPGYFSTLGVPLIRGRDCADSDTADGVLVALVNETAVRRHWPGEDPIGKRFAIGSRERYGFFRRPPSGGIEWREIVGVVGDVRSAGFAADIQPEVFHCYKQYPLYDAKIFVRTAGDTATIATALRREIALVNARAVIRDLKTMDQVAEKTLTDQRLRAGLAVAFSLMALALGTLGIYGLLSYLVGQRTREIGLRMALGADRRQVSRLVMWQALKLTLMGMAIGLGAAAIAGRLIARLLFGVQPFDVVTFAATCVLVLAAALLASGAPAWRATRVAPSVALRGE